MGCTVVNSTQPSLLNPLMANDAFKRHKWFHLLEKGQFSQEKVQMCENHQICRADFGEKNPHFFGTPPVLKRTWGVRGGVPPSQQGSKGHSPVPHCSICMASAWACKCINL